jgi:hypothetical protein
MLASKYSKTINKMLLDHPSIDINLQNNNGLTALTIELEHLDIKLESDIESVLQ